jgi:hypothetical protein
MGRSLSRPTRGSASLSGPGWRAGGLSTLLNRTGAASHPLSGRKTGAPKHLRPDETARYCRAASRLAHEAVVTEDGPHPPDHSREPSPPGVSVIVPACRATRVPQAAVSGGMQRSITVSIAV